MSSTDCKVLLDICTTRVYADNPFRLLNAPVDKGTRVDRHFRDLQAALGLGTLQEEYSQFLRPDPLPTAEVIGHAAHELKDPVRRFVHEFFWFWPMEQDKSASDQGLLALKAGGAEQAQAVWLPAARNGTGRGRFVARHNLAVLRHLMGLAGEAEILQASYESDHIPQDVENVTNSHWQYAFKQWEALSPDEGFWNLLADRIRDFGDARLTTGFLKRFRETLPIAFDNINADIAVELARQGHYMRARTHIKIMEQTNAGADDQEVNFRRIRRPLQDRIEHAVKQATQDIQNQKNEGFTRAVSLYNAAREPLSLLAVLLKKHDPSEYADAADRVAEGLLRCMVEYGNDTQDLRKCREVLQNTLTLAHGANLRERIQKNIDTLDEMINAGMFDLSDAARQMVQKANEAARVKNWDNAIDHLKSAMKLAGRKAPEQLGKNLSASFANRGIERVNRAMELVNAGMKEFQQALERLGRGDRLWPSLFDHLRGVLGEQCDGCGTLDLNPLAGGGATVGLPTGRTARLCPRCAFRLQQLQERGKPSREAIALLTAGAKDLAEAVAYDPSNSHATKNLEEANNILSKFGSAPVRARLPQVRSPSAAKRPVKSTDTRGTARRALDRPARGKATAWWLGAMVVTPRRGAAAVLGLFLLVMLCLSLVVAFGDANTIASRWWGGCGAFWLGLLTVVGGSSVITLWGFATLRGGWQSVFTSRDDLRTAALITLGPLVAYVIGGAILTTVAQKTILSRSGLAAHCHEFLRRPTSTETSSWPSLRGRLVVIDRSKAAVDRLFFDLPDNLRATSYSDVGTVVLLTKGKERSGTYMGGAPAYVQEWKVDIVDWRESRLVGSTAFSGGKAPQSIPKSASEGVGSAPRGREVVRYLLSLPQSEDVIQNREGR